jgi:hypothetical protein
MSWFCLVLTYSLRVHRYVRNEQLSLLTLPREAVLEGRISWSPVPWVGNQNTKAASSTELSDGNGEVFSSCASLTNTFAIVGEWREATAVDGRVYYWLVLSVGSIFLSYSVLCISQEYSYQGIEVGEAC